MAKEKTNSWIVVVLQAVSYLATAIAGYLSNGVF